MKWDARKIKKGPEGGSSPQLIIGCQNENATWAISNTMLPPKQIISNSHIRKFGKKFFLTFSTEKIPMGEIIPKYYLVLERITLIIILLGEEIIKI